MDALGNSGPRRGREPHEYHPITGQVVMPEKKTRARELRQRMTLEERILWGRLRDKRLRGHHFRRQQVLAGFIVDFYCDATRLAVELDGGVHAQQADYDAARDEVLGAHAIRILRIANDDIHHQLTAVLARIVAACEQFPPESRSP